MSCHTSTRQNRMSKPGLFKIPVSSPLALPQGAIREWYAGCHILAHMEDGVLFRISEGKVDQLLTSLKLLFLEGKTFDVIVTNDQEGLCSIFTLKNGVIKKEFDMECQTLNSAHLVIDRILVLVLDYVACGVDLDQETPTKCPLLGFSIHPESLTIVNSHYFYAWTRSAIYRVDLLGEPLSPISCPSPLKISLNPPLEMMQRLLLVRDTLAVIMGPVNLTVYDTSGQVIFEEEIESRDFTEIRGACAFIMGVNLYYLKNHQIVKTRINPEFAGSILFLGSDGYIVDGGSLTPIESASNKPKGQIKISWKGMKVYQIQAGQIEPYSLDHIPKTVPMYALGSWFKRSASQVSNLFEPFLYQVDKMTFLWRLEDGIKPEIRLHVVDFRGVSSSVRKSYQIASLSANPIESVSWKSTREFVFLQISGTVLVFSSLSGVFIIGIPLLPQTEIKYAHSYGTKAWLSIGTIGGFQIQTLLHMDMNNSTFADMSNNLLGILPDATFCRPGDGVLVSFNQIHKNVVVVYPPEHPKRLTPKLYENVQKVAENSGLVFLSGNQLLALVGDDLKPLGVIPDLKIGEFLRLHIGKTRVAILGKTGYAYGILSDLQNLKTVDTSNDRASLRILTANEAVDPDERTFILHNEQEMWTVDEPYNKYKTPLSIGSKGLSGAVAISPRHLVQALILKTSETCVISFVV